MFISTTNNTNGSFVDENYNSQKFALLQFSD